MKRILVWILVVFLASVAHAEIRVLLARFELKGLAGEQPPGNKLQTRVVELYRSAQGTGTLAEFVEVETTLGDKVTRRRLSNAAGGRLLDIFESVSLPNIDYQKHFEELAKAAPEARRGIGWLPDGGGARRELIEVRTKNRVARFEIWSPEICFYSHPSDRIAQLVFRLVDGCSSAIGAATVFVSSSEEPNQSSEPTAMSVTPPAAQEPRQP